MTTEEDFEGWLRSVCFQKPTDEAYDLARDAWFKAKEKAEAERDAAVADAQRYRFLRPLYHSIDFEYADSSEGTTPSLLFAIPPGTRWSGDLDASIDAALAPSKLEGQ
jgi:hypothetical protein